MSSATIWTLIALFWSTGCTVIVTGVYYRHKQIEIMINRRISTFNLLLKRADRTVMDLERLARMEGDLPDWK